MLSTVRAKAFTKCAFNETVNGTVELVYCSQERLLGTLTTVIFLNDKEINFRLFITK